MASRKICTHRMIYMHRKRDHLVCAFLASHFAKPFFVVEPLVRLGFLGL